jgi:hypothetical protein
MIKLHELTQLEWPDGFSEEEKQIAKRLGWYDYMIQLPEFIEHGAVTKLRLNLDTSEVEFIAIRKQKKKAHQPDNSKTYFFGRQHKKMGNEIHVRWAEYCTFYKVPIPWLKANYPYIYTIMRDMYAVNLINSRNNKKLKESMKINFELTTWTVSVLNALYNLLMEVPEMMTYYRGY